MSKNEPHYQEKEKPKPHRSWRLVSVVSYSRPELEWMATERMEDLFHDKDSEQFVARYVERSPLSWEKCSIEDDIVTSTTKNGAAHEFEALECIVELSRHIPKPYKSVTRYCG